MVGKRRVSSAGRQLKADIEVDGKVLERFLWSRERVSIVQGPVGSGKTRAALWRLFMMAAEQLAVEGVRESRWLITRPTGPELKSTILKDFLELFPEEEGWGELVQSPPITFRMRVGNIKAEFVFLALDDEGDIRKLKSTNFTGAFINEGQFVSLVMFTAIRERIGRYPPKKMVAGHLIGGPTHPCMLMDMNAADESHWVPIMRGDVPMPDWFTADQRRQHAMPVKKDGSPAWEFLVQPAALVEIKDSAGMVVGWDVNPEAENLRFLSESYYADKIAGVSKDVIDMTCMNRTGALRGGKPVHVGWNKEVHVAREPLVWRQDVDLVCGLDFGRTPAAVWGQSYGGRWYILGEFYLEDVSASQFAPALKREMSRRMPGVDLSRVRWAGDPAGSQRGQATDQTAFDVMRQNGIQVMPAMAGLRFQARIETVDAILARMVGGFSGLLVDPSCQMLINGFGGGYKWRTVQGRDGLQTIEEAVKNKYSHPMDALQYLFALSGEVREVVQGGVVPKPVDTRLQAKVFRRGRALHFAGRR
jgi:hypothetical protein